MRHARLLPAGFLLLLAFVLPVCAAELPKAVTGKHSAWKVEGKDCSVFLMGSVHVLNKENYPLPAVMETAFSNATIVVFETDIGEMLEMETQMKLVSQATLPDGQTLEDVLSKDTFSDLQNYLKESGVPGLLIKPMKPGLAAMTLVLLEAQKAGYSPEHGMDLYFYNRAKKADKIIRSLESLDFQIGLICDLSKEQGEAVIKSTLKELRAGEEQLPRLLKAWQTGDETDLEKLLNEAEMEFPELMEKFLIDRNKKWVPQIEAMAKGTNNAVVIVGAAHLVGKEGVVELLRKNGAKVTQE